MSPTHNSILKGNSAASKNYWREEMIQYITNIQPYTNPFVTLSSIGTIALSRKGILQLSTKLLEKVREATVLQVLKY